MRLPTPYRRTLGLRDSSNSVVDEEIEAHIDMLAADLVQDGYEPDEARLEATRRFGDVAAIRRACEAQRRRLVRRRRRWERLHGLWADALFAARSFIKRPVLALVTFVTLALAIGANAVVFTILDSSLFRPLPYSEPDRLVVLEESRLPEWDRFWVSMANFESWRELSGSFEAVAAHEVAEFVVTTAGDVTRVRGARVTPNMFATLGARPARGRLFRAEEGRRGRDGVAILSHRFWREQLSGDEAALGSTLIVDDRAVTVVGIMPRGFEFPIPVRRDFEGALGTRFDVWVPLTSELEGVGRRGRRVLQYVTARLAPGVSLSQARAELDAIAEGLAREYPDTNARWGVRVSGALDYFVGEVRVALLWLFATVTLVLGIASLNVASLLLARAIERGREMRIRRSLGAGRGRLARQLLTEGFVIGGISAAAGLLVAWVATRALLQVAADALPRFEWAELDLATLGYALLVTLAAVACCSLAPVLHVMDPRASHDRLTTSGDRSSKLHTPLVVAQVSLSVMVAVGAGLLARSFVSLATVDPGFETGDLLVVKPDLPQGRQSEGEERELLARLIEEIGALPGVDAVTAGGPVPFAQGANTYVGVPIEGADPGQPTEAGTLSGMTVYSNYFSVLGIPVLEGRAFEATDTRDDWSRAFWDSDLPVAIISESAARRDFPGGSPIGKRLIGTRVVGVVGDVIQDRLETGPPPAQYYTPALQGGAPLVPILVRTRGAPSRVVAGIRARGAALDGRLALTFITMEDAIGHSLADRRFVTTLMGILAILALALSASGVYALGYHSAARRTREFGIRRALGARTANIMGLVLTRGFTLTAAGVGLGLMAVFLLTDRIEDQLYGISAHDPASLVGVSVALLLVGVAASWVPALEATRAEANEVLRAE